jgi:transcriptional regulator of heat shock response
VAQADAAAITDLLDFLEAQAEDTSFDSGVLDSLKVKIQTLTIKQNIKNDLLKRVEKLENKQAIIKNFSNLSKNITKKAQKGVISDADVQIILNLLSQIEGVI